MNKGDLSGTSDKKIKDWEQGENLYVKSDAAVKSDLKKDYRGTYVPGQGFTGSGSAKPGTLAHQSVDKESVRGVKDILNPMPKDPGGAMRAKMGKSKEKCIMASMENITGKGVRLVPDVKAEKSEEAEKACDMKTAKSILDSMLEKARPANGANENGPVSGAPHGGSGPAQQSTGSLKHPNSGPAQMYVGGSAHAGRGPAQTSTSVNHPNSGPAQTDVGALQGPGNAGQVSKAITSMAVPRMPRALAAVSVEQWRNAPKASTRTNTVGDMSGPLHGELIESVDEQVASPRNPVMKACPGCGRTYTLRKSDDGCPTCSNLHRGNMTKSRGGLLIPATID